MVPRQSFVVGTAQGARLTVTRIAVLGAGGMLGRDITRVLSDWEPVALTRTDVDITDATAVSRGLEGFDVVINCAAYTLVDDAEAHPEIAHAVNAEGPRHIARALRQTNSKLIHISTDYVFDGQATSPYSEDSKTRPLSVYGESKQRGESAVLEENTVNTAIVRTSWLYGEHGSSFPRTILSAGLTHETLDVVDDQAGQPTWTIDVARHIRELVVAGIPSGVFHATNAGTTTWFDFARHLFRLAGWDENRVRRASSSDYIRPAARPSYSVLGHERWVTENLKTPRDWKDALAEAWVDFLGSVVTTDAPR